MWGAKEGMCKQYKVIHHATNQSLRILIAHCELNELVCVVVKHAINPASCSRKLCRIRQPASPKTTRNQQRQRDLLEINKWLGGCWFGFGKLEKRPTS
jgi:hypothetical protein